MTCRPDRTVVTCHDLDTFRCVLEPERQPRPRWFRAMTERILSGFRKAAHVIADSAATRDEILRFGLHPARPDHRYIQRRSPLLLARSGSSGRLRIGPPSADGRLLHEAIWLLNVGSSMPRKRLDVLLRVFAEVRETGRERSPAAHRRGPDRRTTGAGAATRGELRARGIGICRAGRFWRQPIAAPTCWSRPPTRKVSDCRSIEAMACGCQVIASDLPVLREVGGAAATYCAVGDIEGWRDTIVSALQSPANFDRERAFANAARFSWSENASQTARVYEQVLSGKPMNADSGESFIRSSGSSVAN